MLIMSIDLARETTNSRSNKTDVTLDDRVSVLWLYVCETECVSCYYVCVR